MPTEIESTLLAEILRRSTDFSKGLNAAKFRADHHQHLDVLNKLEVARFIEKKDDKYYATWKTILGIEPIDASAQRLIYWCEHLFPIIRQAYIEFQSAPIDLNKLAKLGDLPRREVNIALSYMVNVPAIFGGYTTSFYAVEDATITPSEGILRHKTFRDAVLEMLSWWEPSSSATTDNSRPLGRLAEIPDFDIFLHSVIINHALPQYKNGHYRDAVVNAILAIFDLIREKSELTDDGDKLIGRAFSIESPLLIFSTLENESGQSEQKGFMQILKGIYQGVRNPTAHSLSTDIDSKSAAQYLIFFSLLAERISETKKVDDRSS